VTDGEFVVPAIKEDSANGIAASSTERQLTFERYERALQLIALMDDEASEMAARALGKRLQQPWLSARSPA
jgi:hypothetical protein